MVVVTDDMCTAGTTATTVYIWGEGKKFYVLTKLCVKKNTFLFSLGIFHMMVTDVIKGGKWVWGFIVILLTLICFIMLW